MSFDFIFIGLIILILAGGIVIWMISRRKSGTRMTSHDLEIKGLNLLLQKRPQEALGVFLDLARKDTNNLRVYMQVADIYRELGTPRKSIDIHEDLLNRPGISDQFRMMIYQSLAEDYEALKQYEKALDYARSVLKINKRDPWAIQAKHDYHRAAGNWAKAIRAFDRLKSIKPDLDERIPVLYKVQEALEKLSAGDTSEATSLLKQAIKMGKPVPAAYYHLGQISQKSGQLKHAIDYYTTFAELEPELGSLVFPEIEKMYFELRQFDSVEQFYIRLRKRQPESVDIAVGLASHLERKGELQEALSTVDEAQVHKPDSRRLSLIRVSLLNKMGRSDAADDQVQRMLTAEYRKNKLTCKFCGHKADYPIYLCPECGKITFDHS